MDDMEPPEQYVETVVEDIHVGIDPGEEIVTSDSTIVTSGIGMNTVVYSGPDGIIMEGDEISGDIVSDLDTLTVGKHSHILHSNSHHQNSGLFVESLLNYNSVIISNTDVYSGFLKSQNAILGNCHIDRVILQEDVDNEMVIEQHVEIGDDLSHGEILLVPNNILKREDIIEGGEIIVGSSIDNEIIIDQIGSNIGHGRFFVDCADADSMMEETFDESGLLDIVENIKFDDFTTFCYDCSECGSKLKNRTALKKHIKTFHGSPRSKVKSKKRKRATVVDNSNLNQLYSCTSCSYATQRRDKLDRHMQKHVLFEGFHPCGKKRHKPTVPLQRHRHNAEEYKCALCSYTCTVYRALKKHHKTHMSTGKNASVKISCKICGKDRAGEADLQKHMKKHRNGKHFTCDICGFGSLQLKKTIQHRRMHTGEKPHLCPHCTYRSARRDNLRSHVRRMHKKDNVYIDTFNPSEERNDSD